MTVAQRLKKIRKKHGLSQKCNGRIDRRISRGCVPLGKRREGDFRLGDESV